MFGPQKIVSKNIVPNKSWLQITLGQSLFKIKIQLVVAEIYHYNETRTNGAGTNVA